MPKSADLPWPAPLCESIQASVYQQYMTEKTDEKEEQEEEHVSEKVDAFIVYYANVVSHYNVSQQRW